MIGERPRKARLKALDETLREMFSSLDALPIPCRVMAVVEQLEDRAGAPAARERKRR